MEGKQWTAVLYSHIFAIEHNRRRMGPQPGRYTDKGKQPRRYAAHSKTSGSHRYNTGPGMERAFSISPWVMTS